MQVNVRMISHLNKIGILLNLGQEHAEELHLLALCGRRLEKNMWKGRRDNNDGLKFNIKTASIANRQQINING
jgi:hypothetical protein